MKSPLATAVTGALFNRWEDGWRQAGAPSRLGTLGGEKHRFRLWENGIIGDLQRFLPALELTKRGCSETAGIPIATSSVTVASQAKQRSLTPGQSFNPRQVRTEEDKRPEGVNGPWLNQEYHCLLDSQCLRELQRVQPGPHTGQLRLLWGEWRHDAWAT